MKALLPYAAFATLVACALLSGCGDDPPETVVLSGKIVKGPVQNATVKLYELQNEPLTTGFFVDQVKTNSNGEFSMELQKGYTGYLLLQVQEGSYSDELTGLTVNLSNSPVLEAVFEKTTVADSLAPVYVHPFSTLQVKLARDSQNQIPTQSYFAASSFLNSMFGFDGSAQLHQVNPALSSISSSSVGTVGFNSFLMAKHLATFSRMAGQEATDDLFNSLDSFLRIQADASDGNYDGFLGSNLLTESLAGPSMFLKAFDHVSLQTASMSSQSAQFLSIRSSLFTTTSFSTAASGISTFSSQAFRFTTARTVFQSTNPVEIKFMDSKRFLLVEDSANSSLILSKNSTDSLNLLTSASSVTGIDYAILDMDQDNDLDLAILRNNPIQPVHVSLATGESSLGNSSPALSFQRSPFLVPFGFSSGRFQSSTRSSLAYHTSNSAFLVLDVFSNNPLTLQTRSVQHPAFTSSRLWLSGDLTGDQLDDLLVFQSRQASSSLSGIHFLQNLSNLQFSLRQLLPDSHLCEKGSIGNYSTDSLQDLITLCNKELRFYKQDSTHLLQLSSSVALPLTATGPFEIIKIEANGTLPREILILDKANSQSSGAKAYPFAVLEDKNLVRSNRELTLPAFVSSVLPTEFNSDSLTDLLLIQSSTSRILLQTQQAP